MMEGELFLCEWSAGHFFFRVIVTSKAPVLLP